MPFQSSNAAADASMCLQAPAQRSTELECPFSEHMSAPRYMDGSLRHANDATPLEWPFSTPPNGLHAPAPHPFPAPVAPLPTAAALQASRNTAPRDTLDMGRTHQLHANQDHEPH